MATISFRIEDEIRDELEDLAAGNGASVSDVIRQAIESFLGRDAQMNWSAPSSLPRWGRLQLSLLHRILQKLESNEYEADHHGRLIEVLERGFTGEYGDAFVAISDELPLSDCKLVWDILDMFNQIKWSVDAIGLKDISAIDDHAMAALTFRGFDANDSLEGKMLGYARHLIEDGRWQDLAGHFDDQHEHGNSHMPTLAAYKRMLEVYRPIWAKITDDRMRGLDRYGLSKDELAEVVGAWYYPR